MTRYTLTIEIDDPKAALTPRDLEALRREAMRLAAERRERSEAALRRMEEVRRG